MPPVPEVLLSPDRSNRSNAKEAGKAVAWLAAPQESEWDDFVRQSPLGSIYHTTEWKAVIEQAFPHVELVTVAYCTHEANSIRDPRAMVDGILSLIDAEKRGVYPGGDARRPVLAAAVFRKMRLALSGRTAPVLIKKSVRVEVEALK